MQLTVVVCSHNPNKSLLQKALEGLRNQTLDQEYWELILVDNRSNPPIADFVDLKWHCNSLMVVEENLGLSDARIRGFREAKTDLLIYVDDDAVLDKTYLENANKIAVSHPYLGVWGGNVDLHLEKPFDEGLSAYSGLLAECKVERELWCNFPTAVCLPRGVGMAVRKKIMGRYIENHESDVLRQLLERRGSSLASGGDSEICYSAFEKGYGVALFPSLKLMHHIPRHRVTLHYLLRLQESMSYSWELLHFIHKGYRLEGEGVFFNSFKSYLRLLTLGKIDRRFHLASILGRRRAVRVIKLASGTRQEKI